MTTPDEYRHQYAAAFGDPPQDERSFHAAIQNNSAGNDNVDRVPPLVYADWLEEHDRPGTAAVIRMHDEANGRGPHISQRINYNLYGQHDHALAFLNSVGRFGGVAKGQLKVLTLALHDRTHDTTSRVHRPWFMWEVPVKYKEGIALLRQLHQEGVKVPEHLLDEIAADNEASK